MNANGKYLKDENGDIFSPIVSTNTIFHEETQTPLNVGKVVKVGLSSLYTVSNSNINIIPLDTIIFGDSNTFSLSSGAVKINCEFSYVYIVAHLYFYESTTYTTSKYICINQGDSSSTGTQLSIMNFNPGSQYKHYETSTITSVITGNYIAMKYKGASGDTIKDYYTGTYLLLMLF